MSTIEGEVIEVDQLPSRTQFVEASIRGQVDMQISSAKRFPRSIQQFQQRAMSLATQDAEVAESCYYMLERRGEGGQSLIEGPSVRLAEIVAHTFGNIKASKQVVDIGQTHVTAQGMCWDMENNMAASVEVVARITKRNGQRYSEDMIITTVNAALSKAYRNAVFTVVPMAYVNKILNKCKEVAAGVSKSLIEKRAILIKRFLAIKVTPEMLFTYLNITGENDITEAHLDSAIGLYTGLKNGDVSYDEAFSLATREAKQTETKSTSQADQVADHVVKKRAPKRTEKPPEQPAAAPAEKLDYLKMISESNTVNELLEVRKLIPDEIIHEWGELLAAREDDIKAEQ